MKPSEQAPHGVELVGHGDGWQLSPIRLKGTLHINLLGLELGRIDLDLTVAAPVSVGRAASEGR